jgi:hypothetical protein
MDTPLDECSLEDLKGNQLLSSDEVLETFHLSILSPTPSGTSQTVTFVGLFSSNKPIPSRFSQRADGFVFSEVIGNLHRRLSYH